MLQRVGCGHQCTLLIPLSLAAHALSCPWSLQLSVLGGGTSTGGSRVLVAAGSTRLLIDAGSRPGGTDADPLAPPRIDVALRARIDAIDLTNAQ